MSRPKKNPGPVPNRWLYCPRKANQLIINKFMALKTPLSSNFDDQVPPECWFHPKMFFDICKKNKMKIGLWIDLTNTSRFYDKKEIEQYGSKYFKLACRGRGETPSLDQTNVFIELVHRFIRSNPLEIVAVHCTHGFNRTGFLIVSYLVQKADFSVDTALQTFAEARPVGIYKQDYLYELYSRHDNIEDTPLAPDLPDWCRQGNDSNESDDDDYQNGNCHASTSTMNPSKKAPKRNKNVTTEFMDGVPGVHYFDEQPRTQNLQKKVQEMCGWKAKGFPGCQPVSMDRDNIRLLQNKPYRVSWKADGMRYMMLIDKEDEVYFFDRNHTVFKVSGLRFVHRQDLSKHLENTLLDGEMVIDKVDGKNIPRYLAYDIITFENINVGEKPFYPDRLLYLELEIIKPRYAAMEQMIIDKSLEPFSIRKKDFWPINQAANLLGEKFAKSLSHEPDGLIFQPSKEPYVAGSCDEVLKWKPLSMNSVDFRLKIVIPHGTGIIATKQGYLYVGQCDQPYSKIKYTKALKDLDGKIIECKYEDDQWKFMRERTDKVHPNSFNTANAVVKSIRYPVTKEDLIHFIERYGYNADSQMMPPPMKKVKRDF